MTSDEPQNIQNNAPNQGAQGIFNAPVCFHYAAPAPETERERRNCELVYRSRITRDGEACASERRV